MKRKSSGGGGGGGWKGGDSGGGRPGWKDSDSGGGGGWRRGESSGDDAGWRGVSAWWGGVGWKVGDNEGGSGGGSWKGGSNSGGGGGWKEGGGWGSSATDAKKSRNQGGGIGGGWAGKNTELDTLLEKLIDSVLLMNDKVDGISNRVDKLEEKVNEEIMLGKKERTEFMSEVKSELAKLKKSQEEGQTVFVGSHLVSKLSKLQKSVESNLPVDIASASKGRRLSTSHLDVQQPGGWDKHLDVQQPSQVHSPWNSTNQVYLSTSHLDVQQPGGWDKHLDVQQPSQVHSPWKSPNQVYSYLNVSDCEKSNIVPSEDHWRPPGENVTKVNVGVVVVSWDTAACGVVARDDLALFKGCCTESLLAHSLLEAEAKAFLTGVRFAVRNGLKNVVIEGDAQNIIAILNDDDPVPSSIRLVIEKIRMLAEMPLPSIEFRFVKKSGNTVARTLASYAKSNLIDQSWESSPPPIIASLLFEESLNSISDEWWRSD